MKNKHKVFHVVMIKQTNLFRVSNLKPLNPLNALTRSNVRSATRSSSSTKFKLINSMSIISSLLVNYAASSSIQDLSRDT